MRGLKHNISSTDQPPNMTTCVKVFPIFKTLSLFELVGISMLQCYT